MFQKASDKKYGLSCQCKECKKQTSKKYYEENKSLWKEKRIRNAKPMWARTTIRNHRRRGNIVNFTNQELLKFIKEVEVCSICGIKLNWFNNRICMDSPTLDRMNNEKHLDLNNIQILCCQCNVSKGNRTMGDFVNYCDWVLQKFKKIEGENNALRT